MLPLGKKGIGIRMGYIEGACGTVGKVLVLDLDSTCFTMIFWATHMISVVFSICVLFYSKNIYNNSIQNNHIYRMDRSSLAKAVCTEVSQGLLGETACAGLMSHLSSIESQRWKSRALKRTKYKVSWIRYGERELNKLKDTFTLFCSCKKKKKFMASTHTCFSSYRLWLSRAPGPWIQLSLNISS